MAEGPRLRLHVNVAATRSESGQDASGMKSGHSMGQELDVRILSFIMPASRQVLGAPSILSAVV